MSIKLYEQVVLKRAIPEDGVQAGDVATLLDIVPGPAGSKGAVLEFFNARGKTRLVTSVPVEDVEPLSDDEVFTVRRLSRAS